MNKVLKFISLLNIIVLTTAIYCSHTNAETPKEELERLYKEQEEAEEYESSLLNTGVKLGAKLTTGICLGASIAIGWKTIEITQPSNRATTFGTASAASFSGCQELGNWLFKARLKKQKQDKKNREKRIEVLEKEIKE